MMNNINDNLKDVNGGAASDYCLTLYGQELDTNMKVSEFVKKYPELEQTLEEIFNEHNASLTYFSNFTLQNACFLIGTSEFQAMINEALARNNK